jgi:SAM-dependent methyltransferase
MSDIANQHMDSKQEAYWNDLVSSPTSRYKEGMMEKLLAEFFPKQAHSLIDIGCGTCSTILKYKKRLNASRIVCTDYDEKIVEEMRRKHGNDGIEWIVADIFKLSGLHDSFDLVFLMDMIHEVYSFYGRPTRDPETPIDHELGLQFTKRAFAEVGKIVRKGGGILLTDDVLSEDNVQLKVTIKNSDAGEAVRYFLQHYPSRKIAASFVDPTTFTIPSRDLNILLTQYNKVKRKDWDRWKIERLEIHEYLSESEYRAMFAELGFKLHSIVGTPPEAQSEWEADFAVIDGARSLPNKRITLLATKQ